MKEKQFYIYMMTNLTNRVLYTGVTNNLVKRAWEHKNKIGVGFTNKYNCIKLVYYELFETAEQAIKREKAIKNLVRRKKDNLVSSFNPQWKDLYKQILSA